MKKNELEKRKKISDKNLKKKMKQSKKTKQNKNRSRYQNACQYSSTIARREQDAPPPNSHQ